MAEQTLLEKAGNRRALAEREFVSQFWVSKDHERAFAESTFFGLAPGPLVQELTASRAEFYARYRQDNLDRIAAVADFVAAAVPPGSRVLEAGCGFGHLSRALEERGLRPTGIDLNSHAIEIGREILTDLSSEIQLHQANALDLPFERGEFGAVVSCDVIEHISEQRSFLTELRRVIAPGGQLFISTDNLTRVNLGVWVRRVFEVFKGRLPTGYKHAWAGQEGGHCALITPKSLTKLGRECGYVDANTTMTLKPGQLFPFLAHKFIYSATRK